jgi:hypothetical protein
MDVAMVSLLALKPPRNEMTMVSLTVMAVQVLAKRKTFMTVPRFVMATVHQSVPMSVAIMCMSQNMVKNVMTGTPPLLTHVMPHVI